MTPMHVGLSAADFYGISTSPERAAELAAELTKLLSAVEHFVKRTDFDDWPDDFLCALAAVSCLKPRAQV